MSTTDDAPLSDLEAAALVEDQRRAGNLRQIREARERAERAKLRADKAKLAFEAAVARAASDRPDRPDWYAHPGPLPHDLLRQAAKLSTASLHTLMERERRRRSSASERRKSGR